MDNETINKNFAALWPREGQRCMSQNTGAIFCRPTQTNICIEAHVLEVKKSQKHAFSSEKYIDCTLRAITSAGRRIKLCGFHKST
jgi:hypothetical protein